MTPGQDAAQRAAEDAALYALGPWAEQAVESTTYARAELIRNVATALAKARAEERERTIRLCEDFKRDAEWESRRGQPVQRALMVGAAAAYHAVAEALRAPDGAAGEG